MARLVHVRSLFSADSSQPLRSGTEPVPSRYPYLRTLVSALGDRRRLLNGRGRHRLPSIGDHRRLDLLHYRSSGRSSSPQFRVCRLWVAGRTWLAAGRRSGSLDALVGLGALSWPFRILVRVIS